MGSVVANPDVVREGARGRSVRLRKAPSLTSLAFLAPALLLYWQLGGPPALLSDPSTGVHVRAGEWILAQHAIPKRDLFSFAIAGRTWCDWEWLSDVLYALLHRWHGLAAIAAFSLAVLCFTSTVIYLTARLHASRIVAFVATCLVMATTTIHWLARPHLFTWLLVAVFCWLIERGRVSGNKRLLVALPGLMLLWVNAHPGFGAGFLMLAVWCASETVQARRGGTREEQVVHQQWSKWFAITGLVCFAVSFANPYGIRLHQHIVAYLFSPNTVTAHVTEWLSPDFHNPRLYWFELLVPFGAAAGVWHGLRGRFAWCALTLGWMHLALVSVRNVPIFGIVCTAPLASQIEHILRDQGWAFRLHTAEASLMRSRVGTLLCYVAALLLIATVSMRSRRLGPQSSLPVDAIAHVRAGRLFTTDRWADYLIYAEPSRLVFFDGRNDVYGPEFVDAYQTVMRAAPGWHEVLNRYGLTAVLVPTGSPIGAALAESADWNLSYRDGIAAVFVRLRPR